MIRYFFLATIYINVLSANIIYESGSLSEFFGGSAPNSSYDNWINHVTEGIANEGFNDYGPEWLDKQTSGFGTYNKLNENDPILDYWENIFSQFIIGNNTIVDSLLQDSLESFYYELVFFEDTVYNKIFHIIREQLDTNMIDLNQLDNELDDIIGGFRNSWGMYIINPLASHKQVIVQVPHPCDDFIAPYIALDMFLETDAYAFMISSAGREVAWTEIDEYSNNKSLSDPSRYPHTVFQKFQQVAIHPLFENNPHWPIVFAVHSFDNASHISKNSIILAAGAQNSFTTKPIRDITDNHFDIINFTEEYPISENQFNNSPSLHVTDYYEVFYDDECIYDNGITQYPIKLATELKGPTNGVQMIDLQSKVNSYSVYEPWIHIELDEKPWLFDSIGVINDTLYSYGSYPTGVKNFSLIREYYKPFINALQDYLNHWETNIDNIAPDSIEFLAVYNMNNSNEVSINWSPIYDTNFKTYEIQVDTDSLFNNPVLFDISDYPMLQYMRLDNQILSGLNNTIPWWFQIRGTDYFGNNGLWSEIATNFRPGHSPPDTLLTFNDTHIFYGIADEDIDEDSFAIDSLNTFPGNSFILSLFGNSWKGVDVEPFTIDSNTVLQIFVKIDSISEIQGIGFANNENRIQYSLSGSEMLNIEDWITVYQGAKNIGSWNSYRLPIGNDWLAWYDSLTIINSIYFINDHDSPNNNPGTIHFSMIQDLTSDLPIKPQVDIEFSVRNIRNENDNQIVTISFYSTIQDTDSFIFSYNWDFGDGNSSIEANPNHDFIIVDNHEYRVMLTVEDETGQQGWSSTTIQIDEGPSSFPIKMNFVGDIMMGRRYEEENGIIQIEGINALFEPTRTLLGMNADITVANLEVPLSNQGYEHPSKGIVFRSSPDNISGLTFAGIDVVSLANNHILDYMEAAMIQTQDILDEAGIMHSGAGMNSYEAYLPTFKSIKGQTIAFLASSDRTGQYNNYQPYLHAGENKSGFAYMTPYYIKQQINSVENIADLVVIEMHAGSEYSYSPGDNYDYASYLIPEGYENLKENPASELGFKMIPKNGLEIEDYSWRLDRPQMWDRAIRHFAIDEGADIVIVHHPHIIQGIELYNGKIIAHSLGNFIFDLNYPETYPSMILNSHADESGFTEFYIDPVYIDDYIPVPAKGELGNYILDYIGMRSKELETYIHVDTDNNRAHVIMDSSIMLSQSISYNALALNYKPVINNEVAYLQTEPMSIPKAGSLSKILTGSPYIVYYRLGKEKVWMKNFEDEGSTLWNLNSDSEMLQDSVFRRGKAGLMHIRSYNSPGNIITNLEERIPFNNQYIHTLHGFIKTKNAKNVTLEIRCSTGRTNQSLFTEAINDTISETTNWKKYWDDIPYHEEAEFFDIRINSDIPDSGVAYSWFDDVGLIQWDSLQSILEYPISISYPNDYDYIQFLFHESQTDTIGLELQNTIIGDFGPLIPYPKVVQRVKTIPNTFYFFDESKGPAGEKIWSFNSEIFGFGETAVLNIDSPGIYEITLTVMGLNNQEATQTITVFGLGSNDEEHMVGDLNNDGIITIVDILLCANYVIEIFEPSTQEFIAADIDKNGTIDIFDILLITDLIN